MDEIIGALHHRGTDPLAELALSSLPAQSLYTKHIVRLSSAAENAISFFQPLSFYNTWDSKMDRYKGHWHCNNANGFTFELPQRGNSLLVLPAKGMGWAIFAEANNFYRTPGRPSKYYVLTVADTSEAVIVASRVEIAQKLAVPAYQRCWLGNCPSPLPGLRWRPVPHDYWSYLFEETSLHAGAPALDSDHFEWRHPDFTIPLATTDHQKKINSAGSSN